MSMIIWVFYGNPMITFIRWKFTIPQLPIDNLRFPTYKIHISIKLRLFDYRFPVSTTAFNSDSLTEIMFCEETARKFVLAGIPFRPIALFHADKIPHPPKYNIPLAWVLRRGFVSC